MNNDQVIFNLKGEKNAFSVYQLSFKNAYQENDAVYDIFKRKQYSF